MENNLLNDKSLLVFVILAETLSGWKDPGSEEGRIVLLKHYSWAKELKMNGKLILGGPMNFDLNSTDKNKVTNLTTGLIMLNTHSREEAEEWAFKDPFHTHGFRKNTVHSMKISITESSVFNVLDTLL